MITAKNMSSSYSTSTLSARMPWLSNASSSGSFDRKRSTCPLMYSIFSDLAENVDDPQWKSILLDSAKGKFPKGFIYNGKTLIFRSTGKNVEIVNNADATNAFMNIVRNNIGFRSVMDLEREKDNERESAQSTGLSNKQWSNIKSKANKKLLIIDFISKMKRVYNLNGSEITQLNNLLTLNMKDPALNKSIILVNDSIHSINNLHWDNINRMFSLTGISRKTKELQYKSYENVIYVNKPLDIDNDKVNTLKDWNKFLKEFNKSIGRIQRNHQEAVGAQLAISSPRVLSGESSGSGTRESFG